MVPIVTFVDTLMHKAKHNGIKRSEPALPVASGMHQSSERSRLRYELISDLPGALGCRRCGIPSGDVVGTTPLSTACSRRCKNTERYSVRGLEARSAKEGPWDVLCTPTWGRLRIPNLRRSSPHSFDSEIKIAGAASASFFSLKET